MYVGSVLLPKGVARGDPGVPVTPPPPPLCKPIFSRRKRHNMVSTLCLKQCEPPFKNPGYAPVIPNPFFTGTLIVDTVLVVFFLIKNQF